MAFDGPKLITAWPRPERQEGRRPAGGPTRHGLPCAARRRRRRAPLPDGHGVTPLTLRATLRPGLPRRRGHASDSPEWRHPTSPGCDATPRPAAVPRSCEAGPRRVRRYVSLAPAGNTLKFMNILSIIASPGGGGSRRPSSFEFKSWIRTLKHHLVRLRTIILQ